jgi:hypothetical protein
MILSDTQLSKILSIIERNTLIFSIDTLGVEILTEQDKTLLDSFGIDYEKLKTDWPVFTQSFYFGRLTIALGDANSKNLDYDNFLKYLKKGQYIPLTDRERNMLEIGKLQTYSHIKGLGETMKQTVNGIVYGEDLKKRADYENLIKDEIKLGIEQRRGKRSIMIEIGKKTGDWQRNLGRIVQTEYQNIYQEGRAAQILERYGEDAQVYKDVFPGACRWCIKLFLVNGIGSKPIVFKLKDLINNGNNIGVKPLDYKPTISSIHPFDRCELRMLFKGEVWDVEKEKFVYPKRTLQEVKPGEMKPMDKKIVGDKVFWI